MVSEARSANVGEVIKKSSSNYSCIVRVRPDDRSVPLARNVRRLRFTFHPPGVMEPNGDYLITPTEYGQPGTVLLEIDALRHEQPVDADITTARSDNQRVLSGP